MKVTFYESGVEIQIPEKDFERFVTLGLLIEESGKYFSNVGKAYFVKKSTGDIEAWIDDWRNAWKGKKIGAMGDRNACLQKMKQFLSEYPQYDKDLIYLARDAYINSMEGSFTFLMQADYFIFKQDPSARKVSRSKLAALCEDIKNNGAYKTFIENPFDVDL